MAGISVKDSALNDGDWPRYRAKPFLSIIQEYQLLLSPSAIVLTCSTSSLGRSNGSGHPALRQYGLQYDAPLKKYHFKHIGMCVLRCS